VKARLAFDLVAGSASIAGLVLVFIVGDQLKGWIAFGIFLLFVLFIGDRCVRALNDLLKLKYPKGYLRLAAFNRYTCLDGKTIEYEVYRFIQCKRHYLTTVDHGFKWSGSHRPQIVCTIHKLKDVTFLADSTEYDKVYIELNHALLYNQVAVVPIKMILDDTDKVSTPHVMTRVDEPSQLLAWRVELGDADRSTKPARFMRKKIDAATGGAWELLETIQYDPVSKCYQKEIHDPALGYHYRVVWDRI
jgi:hypothetical protein